MYTDPTTDENVVEDNNSHKQQRTNKSVTDLTHVKQYKQDRIEERGPEYKCFIECGDIYDENNVPNCSIKKAQL